MNVTSFCVWFLRNTLGDDVFFPNRVCVFLQHHHHSLLLKTPSSSSLLSPLSSLLSLSSAKSSTSFIFVNIVAVAADTISSSSSTDHDVQDDAHGPDVVQRGEVADALQDLGGGVSSTTAERLAQGGWRGVLEEACEAEVGDLDAVLLVEQQVLTFQVSREQRDEVKEEFVAGWLRSRLAGYRPNNMLLYLRQGFAEASIRAVIVRQKLQVKLAISSSHSTLTPGHPLLVQTL